MKLIFVGILLLTQNCLAQKVWVEAVGAVMPTNRFALTDYYKQQFANRAENPSLALWGQEQLDNFTNQNEFLKSYEEQLSMTNASERQFVKTLIIKIKATHPQKALNLLTQLYCQLQRVDLPEAIDADETTNENISCANQQINLKKLFNKYPFLSGVFIENKFYDKNSNLVPLSDKDNYRWLLVSNAHSPIKFQGTLRELIAQHFVFEPIVTGDCSNFESRGLEFALSSRVWVYFSESCQKSQIEHDASLAKWYQKNKTWVIPAGVVSAGLLFFLMKDKTLVITKP